MRYDEIAGFSVCFFLLGTAVDANTIRQGKLRSSRVWPPNEMIPNDRHAVYVAPPFSSS